MMGRLIATSPATPPSSDQKVPLLLVYTCNNSVWVILRFVNATFARVLGVNIGGAGSYVYDNPVNEAPAAVSMETDAKPEEKKAPARGPVKGEKYVEQK